jgi:hypothetical protein
LALGGWFFLRLFFGLGELEGLLDVRLAPLVLILQGSLR